MPPLELAHPLLLNVAPTLGFRELHLEELGGVRGLPLAVLQVALDVEGRERVGHLRDGARVAALVADGEGHGRLALPSRVDTLEIKFDVGAHSRDDVLERDSLPQFGVEPEAVDQLFEP